MSIRKCTQRAFKTANWSSVRSYIWRLVKNYTENLSGTIPRGLSVLKLGGLSGTIPGGLSAATPEGLFINILGRILGSKPRVLPRTLIGALSANYTVIGYLSGTVPADLSGSILGGLSGTIL
jgi:hypothetical protein